MKMLKKALCLLLCCAMLLPVAAQAAEVGQSITCYGDDLTSEQFREKTLNYQGNPLQLREVHFAREEKRLRYESLRASLLALLQEEAPPKP